MVIILQKTSRRLFYGKSGFHSDAKICERVAEKIYLYFITFFLIGNDI